MKTIAIVLTVALASGCASIQQDKLADAYAMRMASNATEYGNGQIPLSEKLKRDYLAGVQYGQINQIEAACTEAYMWLAQDVERGAITEARFNERRDSLEMTCSKAYVSNQYAPVDMWRIGYLSTRPVARY